MFCFECILLCLVALDTLPFLLCSAESLEPNVPARSCEDAMKVGGDGGVYLLQLSESYLEPFYVYCLKDPNNGAPWTIIQRRQDGNIDFYRDWQSYKHGFGSINGEYFLGLDIIHALTKTKLHELWIEMEDFEGQTRYAKYDAFAIGNERSKYELSVLGQYSGNAGDSLTEHSGHPFSTKDVDNTSANFKDTCAVKYTGAWWYFNCHRSNLNGQNLRGEYHDDKYAQGINWRSWHGYYYSLKYVHMAIRPK